MRPFYLQQFLHQHDGEVPIHAAYRFGDTDRGTQTTTGDADRQPRDADRGMQTTTGDADRQPRCRQMVD